MLTNSVTNALADQEALKFYPGKPVISPISQLLRLGNIYELNFGFEIGKVRAELEGFESDWAQYNPYKPEVPRQGLSLTSLDGSLGGRPDLYSLKEFHRREGVLYREKDFRVLTPVYEGCPSIRKLVNHFKPHLGRSHFLRFGAGGYFPPHRDSSMLEEPETFRILVPLAGASRNGFVFLYDEKRVVLEAGCTYFINTLVNHSLFAFAPVTLLVLNVIANEESVALTKSVLMQV